MGREIFDGKPTTPRLPDQRETIGAWSAAGTPNRATAMLEPVLSLYFSNDVARTSGGWTVNAGRWKSSTPERPEMTMVVTAATTSAGVRARLMRPNANDTAKQTITAATLKTTIEVVNAAPQKKVARQAASATTKPTISRTTWMTDRI